jgi:hypothetical protein
MLEEKGDAAMTTDKAQNHKADPKAPPPPLRDAPFDPLARDPHSDTLEPRSTSQVKAPLPETYSPPSSPEPEEVSRKDFRLAPEGHRDYVAGQPVDEEELALTTAAADRKLEAARADAKRRDERSAHRSPRSPDDPNQPPGSFDAPDWSPPSRFQDDDDKKDKKDKK